MGATHHLKVVCDTNTVVSALIFRHGQLDWLRTAWRRGAVVPLVGNDTSAELLRVLAYPKFRLTSKEREELLGDYLPFAKIVQLSDPPEVPVCRDPHDRMFLELALAARADRLVSGDEDLLALNAHFSIPIVTPAELRKSVDELSSRP